MGRKKKMAAELRDKEAALPDLQRKFFELRYECCTVCGPTYSIITLNYAYGNM
jgi:hydrogenase maturation factor HypF (carbamoyltransferase family)